MPFDNPPMPSQFDVGLPTGGHAHFDDTGVTFYDTDGVTQVFEMDFATGLLTIGPPSGKRLVIDPTDAAPLKFYSNNAGGTEPAEIFSLQNSNNDTWFYMQGEDYSSAQGPPFIGIHTGAGGTFITFSLSQGNLASLIFSGSSLRLDAGANAGAHFQSPRHTDFANCTVLACYNTSINTGWDGGSQAANVKDASGNVDYSHGLGITPNIVLVESGDASCWAHKLNGITSVGWTETVRNSAMAFPASGTAISIRWAAYA